MQDPVGKIGHAPVQFHSKRYIGGLTHGFYRYPAATSPEIVREILLSRSAPNDWILDPFMGGGTTIVEALAHGRKVVGSDLNSLATFVTRAKSTPLGNSDWDCLHAWYESDPLRASIPESALHAPSNLPRSLRNPLARALLTTEHSLTRKQRLLARCALLRTAQWALESSYLYPRRPDNRRNQTPRVGSINAKLGQVLADMRAGMAELIGEARQHGAAAHQIPGRRLLYKSAAELLLPRRRLSHLRGNIKLVITSPPYPGVHVLYHRWQIGGRRETTAPYWITGQNDGMAFSYYTMGGRHPKGLENYFERLELAFRAIRPFLRPNASVVQLVAFSRADEQLPRYLAAMSSAGYRRISNAGGAPIREVPNRRWYARANGLDAGREYLLVHKPRS